jgi:hypothetical protein
VRPPTSLTDAVAADTALQQERNPDDRTAIPHPLAFGRAFAEEAEAPGGEGEPCTGIGGDSPIERRVDMPPARWHRRSSHDGESRPGVLAVRRSRRSRVSVRRRCVAHAPGQGEKHQTCRGRALHKSRRRYERQGLLVEPQALTEVQRELALCRRRDGAGLAICRKLARMMGDDVTLASEPVFKDTDLV